MDRASARPTTSLMATNPSYQQQTRDLIDGLKAVCGQNVLGDDGNVLNGQLRVARKTLSPPRFSPSFLRKQEPGVQTFRQSVNGSRHSLG